jgi:septal ring-binding cell division protein DamX
MRFFCFAFALGLLSMSAAAQDRKDTPSPSSTSVVINGQPIKGKVLELDGKHYVAVEDMVQTLHGTIAYNDGQIALSLPQISSAAAKSPPAQHLSATTATAPPPIPPVTAQPLKNGTVKGTLTYFFDFHTGSKADAGSKVWLVKGHIEIPANENFVASSTALGSSSNPEQYSAAKYAVADESGKFELLDTPPGEYTLVLQSAHTKWTLNEKRDFFGRGNGHSPRDSDGRVEFLKVVVKEGETSDASKDFGPNIVK